MTDIKDLLRLAVEDEPTTAFDVGRTFTAGRRRLRRRRIAMAGAAVLSVVAVAAAVTLGVPALQRSAPATHEAPAPNGAERASQLTRLLAHLPVLPEGMQRISTNDRLVDPRTFTASDLHYGNWSYTQHGGLTDAQGTGSLEVNVITSGTFPDCTASSVPGLTCTHRTGPDGADLQIYHQTGEGGWSGTAVLRRLPDGSWASAWTSSLSWNLMKEGWSYTEVGWLEVPAGVKATRPAPPLPVERLIDIVTAIAAI